MKRASIILSLVAILCYSVIAEPKQKPLPKLVAVQTHRSIWRVLLVPAKYAFAGLLRIKLNSKGEPYE